MLHIILTILKIVGIILLVLLALILLILLAVLLVPVHYRATGEKEEKDLHGQVVISWLLHILHIRICYRNKQMEKEVFLFGIPLFALRERIRQWKKDRARKKRIKERKKSKNSKKEPEAETLKRETAPDNKTETIVDAQTDDHTETTADTQADDHTGTTSDTQTDDHTETTSDTQADSHGETAGDKQDGLRSKWKKLKKFSFHPFAFIRSFLEKIQSKIRKIKFTIQGTCDKIKYYYRLLQAEATKNALADIKYRLKKILKHIFPRKIQGALHFGFEDPSWTGRALGAVAVFYPKYGKQISITPYFDREILEGQLDVRGRIRVGTLLWHALKLYMNKEVKQLYKRIRHKEA